MEWSKALSLLKEGNKRFVENSLTNHKDCLVTARERNALKQKPFAVILSCADSRVVPELAFDVGIGELFVIRVAGNVANKHTIASIEYAVAILDVNIIVVMGHESCGAITAAMKGMDMESKNLSYLISYITPAIEISNKDSDINEVVKKNAELTAKSLVLKSSIIQKIMIERDIQVFSAYYNLSSGVVDFFEVNH